MTPFFRGRRPVERKSFRRVKGLPRRGARSKKGLRRRWQYLKRKIGTEKIALFFILLLFSLVFYVLFFSPLLRVREVAVTIGEGGTKLEEASLEQQVEEDVLGKNIIFVRRQSLYNLVGDVTIREIRLTKRWPHRLEIEIEKRKARAVLKDAGGRLFFVDEEGVVFGRAQEIDLPVISYPARNLSLGEEIEERAVNFVLYLLGEVAEAELEVKAVQAGGTVRLKVVDGPDVILPREENAVEKMISMVKEFRAQGSAVAKIDLRFQNPVVEYTH